MSLPSWITQAESWIRPELANIYIPGTVVFRNIAIEKKHPSPHRAKKAGQSYGSMPVQGLLAPEFEFEVSIAWGEEEQLWDQVVPYFYPRGKTEALPVKHPELQKRQIFWVFVSKLSSRLPVADNGFCMIHTIRMIATQPNFKNASTLILGKKKPITKPANTNPAYEQINGSEFANSAHEAAELAKKQKLSKPKVP